MTIEEQLQHRSGNKCELCGATENLTIYKVPPGDDNQASKAVYICDKCSKQLDKKEPLDAAHWVCLKDTMWSDVAPVQVVAWRMLNRLKNESWASEALDMLYLDDEILEWARATGDHENEHTEIEQHRDSNGALLENGDSVTLIKSLDVKGSQVNARIGTAVRNIKLVPDNTEQIEGKIDGQLIVILTKYVRKSN